MLDMLSVKIFLQIRFAWQENVLADFEKIALQNKTKKKTAPFPAHTQHKLKFSLISV